MVSFDRTDATFAFSCCHFISSACQYFEYCFMPHLFEFTLSLLNSFLSNLPFAISFGTVNSFTGFHCLRRRRRWCCWYRRGRCMYNLSVFHHPFVVLFSFLFFVFVFLFLFSILHSLVRPLLLFHISFIHLEFNIILFYLFYCQTSVFMLFSWLLFCFSVRFLFAIRIISRKLYFIRQFKELCLSFLFYIFFFLLFFDQFPFNLFCHLLIYLFSFIFLLKSPCKLNTIYLTSVNRLTRVNTRRSPIFCHWCYGSYCFYSSKKVLW